MNPRFLHFLDYVLYGSSMNFQLQYTLIEELLHSLIHAIGAVLAVVGLVVLSVLLAPFSTIPGTLKIVQEKYLIIPTC